MFHKDVYDVYISDVVLAEVNRAPEVIKKKLLKLIEETELEVLELTKEAEDLAVIYLERKIVPEKKTEDALHVAIATVSQCSLIVSWNFKHIVHFDKIPKYNAVNTLNCYGQIGIYSPLEVISYDSDDS